MCLNVLIAARVKKQKVTAILRDEASKLEVSSKELFGKSFRRYVMDTSKAKKESKQGDGEGVCVCVWECGRWGGGGGEGGVIV